jgi:hypothetical protein
VGVLLELLDGATIPAAAKEKHHSGPAVVSGSVWLRIKTVDPQVIARGVLVDLRDDAWAEVFSTGFGMHLGCQPGSCQCEEADPARVATHHESLKVRGEKSLYPRERRRAAMSNSHARLFSAVAGLIAGGLIASVERLDINVGLVIIVVSGCLAAMEYWRCR